MNNFINILIIFLLSFCVTSIFIPIILNFLDKRKIYDKKNHLKKHEGFIPTLGGVAIISGVILSQVFIFFSFPEYSINFFGFEYLSLSILILFSLGIIDDILDLDPLLKFIMQFLVSLIIIWKADLYLTSLNGLFGVFEIPLYISYILSIFIIIFIINSYNLIDGIDTIASLFGIIYLSFFGLVCFFNNLFPELFLCISIIGSLISFLYYNKPPAKIFMGDSGTLVIGLIISYYVFRLFDESLFFNIEFNPIFFVALLLYPVTDTLRVIFLRIINGISPFRGDRRHIHHVLVDFGFGHLTTSLIIVTFNLIVLCCIINLNININYQFLVILIFTAIGLGVVSFLKRTNKL